MGVNVISLSSSDDLNYKNTGSFGADIMTAVELLEESDNILHISSMENLSTSDENGVNGDFDTYAVYNDMTRNIIHVGGVKLRNDGNGFVGSFPTHELELFQENMLLGMTDGGSSSLGVGVVAGKAAELASQGLILTQIITGIV